MKRTSFVTCALALVLGPSLLLTSTAQAGCGDDDCEALPTVPYMNTCCVSIGFGPVTCITYWKRACLVSEGEPPITGYDYTLHSAWSVGICNEIACSAPMGGGGPP